VCVGFDRIEGGVMDLRTLYGLKRGDEAAYDAAVAALGGGGIYRLPADNVALFEQRLGRIFRAADKIGVARPAVERDGPHDESYVKYDGERVVRSAVYVHVTGEAPKLAGWRFVATIEHDESGKAILRSVPGIDIELAEYRLADPAWCDHCQLDRRRTETFVVVHDDGTRKRVGRTCLKDFMGHGDPVALARWLEMILGLDEFLGEYDDDEGFFGGGGGQRAYESKEVLATAARIVNTIGWVPRSKADLGGRGPATAGIVLDVLNPPKDPSRELREWLENLLPGLQDEAEAAEVLEWLRALGERDGLSDYEWNLSVVAEADYVTARRIAMLASGVVAFRREKERELKIREAAARCNEWLGEVGQRLRGIEVTVETVRHGEGHYGFWTLLLMRDADGRTLKWFAAGELEVAAGDEFLLDGTVKEHEVYRPEGSEVELRQTGLTRCKLTAREAVLA